MPKSYSFFKKSTSKELLCMFVEYWFVICRDSFPFYIKQNKRQRHFALLQISNLLLIALLHSTWFSLYKMSLSSYAQHDVRFCVYLPFAINSLSSSSTSSLLNMLLLTKHKFILYEHYLSYTSHFASFLILHFRQNHKQHTAFDLVAHTKS